mgnify:CR=1 FL=1
MPTTPHPTPITSTLAALALAATAAAQCDPSTIFPQTNPTYAAGNEPVSVTAADLDGDGDTDLATANDDSSDVSVLLNNGDGTFAAPQTYASPFAPPFAPQSVTAADLDGDGEIDLATANDSSDVASVLLNNGDGTFAAPQTFDIGNSPNGVTAADLDGDGDIDLATVSSLFGDPGSVDVLLNNGDFSFPNRQTYVAGGGPFGVTAADLDGDGDTDLAVANRGSDDVGVLLNNGDGTFAPQQTYAAGSEPLSVKAADLDADGDTDLATANGGGADVSVLLNNGDGTYAPGQSYSTGFSRTVTLADLDADGDIDIATANGFLGNDVTVLLNNGDGTFAPQQSYAAGDRPESVTAADLDGDGDLDLATANAGPIVPGSGPGGNNVSVLLNQCPPTTTPCTADTNNDQTVGLDDLLTVLANFGNTTTNGPADGDIDPPTAPDGTVGLGDLLLLLANFGNTCP